MLLKIKNACKGKHFFETLYFCGNYFNFHLWLFHLREIAYREKQSSSFCFYNKSNCIVYLTYFSFVVIIITLSVRAALVFIFNKESVTFVLLFYQKTVIQNLQNRKI